MDRDYLLKAIRIVRNTVPKIDFQTINLANQIRESAKPAIEALANFRKIYTPALAEMFERMHEGFLETEEDIKLFKTAMVKMGYPTHDSIDITLLREIAADVRENDIEYVFEYIDEIMTKYYNPDFLVDLSLKWEEIDIDKERLKLLRNAVMAHRLGMYHLVVPSVLSQYEGIIMDAFDIKGKTINSMLKILLEELLIINNDGYLTFDDSIHKFYDKIVMDGFVRGQDLESDLNRNAILHGYASNFGNEITSLKSILLVDYLLNKVQNIPENRRESGVMRVQEEQRRREEINRRNKRHGSKKKRR